MTANGSMRFGINPHPALTFLGSLCSSAVCCTEHISLGVSHNEITVNENVVKLAYQAEIIKFCDLLER